MNMRALSLYSAVAVTGLTMGGAFALWMTGIGVAKPDAAPPLAVASDIPDSVPLFLQHGDNTPAQGEDRERHGDNARPLDMRSDNFTGFANNNTGKSAAQATKQSLADAAAKKAEDAPRKFDWAVPEQPVVLDLKLPESTAPEDAVSAADEASGAAQLPPAAAFDLAPPPDTAPEIESYSLFNPEYGLRGFMAQSWVNQRFGIQGGLGLNDDRLLETDKDLRDNIAVGMGVILAF